MTLLSFHPGCDLELLYVNHRGVRKTRTVTYTTLKYGNNEWYPEAQWFLRGRCHEREAERSFALLKIVGNVTHL